MKIPVCLLLLISCLPGCEKASTTSINPAISECIGSSTYFIDNKSSYDLSVAFILTKELGGKTDSSQTVASGQRKQVAQDGTFGYIPKPADTFTSLTFSRIINGQKISVYQQNPIINTRWVKVKQHPNDPDYGCYAVTHTLTITSEELN